MLTVCSSWQFDFTQRGLIVSKPYEHFYGCVWLSLLWSNNTSHKIPWIGTLDQEYDTFLKFFFWQEFQFELMNKITE